MALAHDHSVNGTESPRVLRETRRHDSSHDGWGLCAATVGGRAPSVHKSTLGSEQKATAEAAGRRVGEAPRYPRIS
jgi:hypothetical protein